MAEAETTTTTTTTPAADKQAEEEPKTVTEEAGADKAEVEASAAGGQDGGKPEAEAEADKEEAEKAADNIYDSELLNRIIVGRTHPLSFYVDRARRVFRIEEEVFVQGRGDNIATTCKLVEALKRQKVAEIAKISTGMNVEPYFNAYEDVKWGPPTAIVLFTLKRGEFGKYIADYQQRKIIEIFENADEKQEGVLSMEKVDSLKLETAFKANEAQIEEAKQFKEALPHMNLPTFIKYASLLIHPLLKAKVFKEILATEFGLEVSGASSKKADAAKAAEEPAV